MLQVGIDAGRFDHTLNQYFHVDSGVAESKWAKYCTPSLKIQLYSFCFILILFHPHFVWVFGCQAGFFGLGYVVDRFCSLCYGHSEFFRFEVFHKKIEE